MSQWTHVNASIRFDGIMNMGLPTEEDLGRICRWEDDDTSHWKDSKLPCGSEGGLEYKIIRNPDDSSLAAMVVVFWGDLRDYDDTNEIYKYFSDITKDRIIRSGIIEIDVESKEKQVFSYDTDHNVWVQLI